MRIKTAAAWSGLLIVLMGLPFIGSYYENFILDTILIYTLVEFSLTILIGYGRLQALAVL